MLQLFQNCALAASTKLFLFNVLIQCPKWTAEVILFNLSLFTTIWQSVAWHPFGISASDDRYQDYYDEVEFSEVRFHKYPRLGLRRGVCVYPKDNDQECNI